MNLIEKAKVKELIDRVTQLLQGKTPGFIDPLVGSEDLSEDLNELIRLINEVIKSFSEIHQFILPLSRGIITLEPPKTGNLMASPFKELHSQLRTLTWQVQQIAKGDYKQRVAFMGEFSSAFNNLVETLAEKDRLVKEQIHLQEQEAIRLKESEKRYVLALEHSPGGIYILDPVSMKVLECNKQVENILGYGKPELINMKFSDFYHDSSLAETDLVNIMNKSFYTIRSRQLRKKDGEIIDADIHTCWSVGVTNSVIIVNIQDVTEKNQAEQVLNKYRILLNEVKDIIIFSDEQGRIIEANKEAERTYGYNNDELGQMSIYDIFIEPSRTVLEKGIEKAYDSGIVIEAINLRKNGSTFPVEVSARGSIVGNKRVLAFIVRDISDRKKVEDELHYLATHDALTRISNRYGLEEAIAKVLTNQGKGTLLLIDIDNFKLVNETLGHAVGDKLLIGLVALIKEHLRKEDVLARIGGDKFALLLSGVDLNKAKIFAEKLRTLIVEKIGYTDEYTIIGNLTISIGMTSINNSLLDVNEIITQANFALHQAKEQGRNRVVCLTCEQKSSEKFRETNRIIRLLTDTSLSKRLILHFQPIFNMESGEVVHYEGLLRLIGVSGELIYPGKFIPIAERFGLMGQIDKQVVKLAFEALIKYPLLKLFINVSGASIGDEALFNFIREQIITLGINPSRIGFEITETAAVKDLPQADRWIKGLKKIGCSFALDDFGIGFSTFSYLQYLPVDYVKIDGSYVRELDRNEKHRALVQAINTVALSLGKTTIAEFVENISILNVLKELNINHVQGNLIGKPEEVPIARINKVI